MGKVTDLGMAKKDDPIFTGGYELFSRPEPRRPSAVDPAPALAKAPAAGKAARRSDSRGSGNALGSGKPLRGRLASI